MNPNDPKNLDPKLRETYERVMGTSPQNTKNPKTPEPTPIIQPPPPPIPQPIQQLPPTPKIEPIETQLPPLPQNFQQPNIIEGDSPVQPPKKKSKLKPFLIILGLVFFIIYGVIWAKLFGIF